jgi:Spy/CpxP family protein refolding chaperone
MLALAAVVLSAQGMPRGGAFPWWDSPLVRDLNLTEDQQQQIKNTVREYRNKLIEARAAAEKAEGDLNDVYEEDRIDQRRAAPGSPPPPRCPRTTVRP